MKTLKKITLVSALAITAASTSTFAVVDPAIQSAFEAASTDATTVVGYIALALVAFVAALWVVKAIRKG